MNKDTIKLYQFAPGGGLPNLSPFCLKLETYLRMANIPFSIVENADIRKAPKGKMPYIEHEGKLIGDSTFIIDYLKEAYGDTLDGNLNSRQKALGLSMQRMIEENAYWVGVYSRWIDDDFWPLTRSLYFGGLPLPLRAIVPNILRRKIRRDIIGHGMGKHTKEEIYAIGFKDLKALSDILGDRPYFLGEAPASVDASCFGFLANVYLSPFDTPLKAKGAEYPHLLEYCVRVRGQFFTME